MRRIHFYLFLLICSSLLLASGCAKRRVISPAHRKPVVKKTISPAIPKGAVKPKTYTINGKSYTTIASAHGFTEVGLASWYGKDFHGRPTANGETYDMYGMTSAHKLLPFNTKVKVTNLENGKTTVVRINDRGPFIRDRIIDLSYTAAQALDIVGPGTAKVRLENVSSIPQTSQGDLAGNFFVQLGAFSQKANAEKLCKTMRESNKPCRLSYVATRSWWRVQVGPYTSISAAEKARASLPTIDSKSFIVAD